MKLENITLSKRSQTQKEVRDRHHVWMKCPEQVNPLQSEGKLAVA